jgi:hypothetical protein
MAAVIRSQMTHEGGAPFLCREMKGLGVLMMTEEMPESMDPTLYGTHELNSDLAQPYGDGGIG